MLLAEVDIMNRVSLTRAAASIVLGMMALAGPFAATAQAASTDEPRTVPPGARIVRPTLVPPTPGTVIAVNTQQMVERAAFSFALEGTAEVCATMFTDTGSMIVQINDNASNEVFHASFTESGCRVPGLKAGRYTLLPMLNTGLWNVRISTTK
jgi:hypothetical protein